MAIEQRLPDSSRLLTGSIGSLYATGPFTHQFSRLKAKHLLQRWVHHLVCCWQWPEPEALCSQWIARSSKGPGIEYQRFERVTEPTAHLERLVGIFDDGQSEPLLFFPGASRRFAELFLGKGRGDPMSAAGFEWRADQKWDASVQRVYGPDAALADILASGERRDRFEELALAVFTPLLEHLRDVPLAREEEAG